MKLWNKLTSHRGETLTETLVGILVVALSSVVLASMVAAASRMNSTAMAADTALYAAVTEADKGTKISTKTVTVTVKVGSESHIFTTPGTDLCGDESLSLYSYRYEKVGETP